MECTFLANGFAGGANPTIRTKTPTDVFLAHQRRVSADNLNMQAKAQLLVPTAAVPRAKSYSEAMNKLDGGGGGGATEQMESQSLPPK